MLRLLKTSAALALALSVPALHAGVAAAAALAPAGHERVIPLEQGSNFRDIGGYATQDGQHVRWGLIYRSGATPLLTADDQTRIKALNLAHMVDLRSDEEGALAPTRSTACLTPRSAIRCTI